MKGVRMNGRTSSDLRGLGPGFHRIEYTVNQIFNGSIVVELTEVIVQL